MHEIVYFQLRYLSLVPLQPIKYALDHEGRAVGEGCCGALPKSAYVENGYIIFAILVIIVRSLRRAEPFRGIATLLRFLAMT